jgi:hypothetical protein
VNDYGKKLHKAGYFKKDALIINSSDEVRSLKNTAKLQGLSFVL